MSERTADRVAELLGADGPLAERYSIVGTLDGAEKLSRWRAEDRETQKPVVISATTVPLDGAVWAALEERLVLLRDSPHGNIVEVVDFGQHEGLAWVVETQVAQGETLAAMLEREGRLTLQELIPIVAQVLKAYGHTHLRALPVGPLALDQIHLVERSNKLNFVRMERFGWSNPLRGNAREVDYTAPEDPRGATPTMEGDVFILGRLIFEALAGARLDLTRFGPDGDGQATSAHGDTLVELVPESEGVPPEFYTLVAQCLAERPDERPVDANAVVEELIDCIPMNMFRLPAKPGTQRAVPRANESSIGSSSLILTGSWKAAAEKQLAREDRSGGFTESSDDLSASGSRALSSSQSMRSERSSASLSASRTHHQSNKAGVPTWAVAAGAVGLVAAGALAVIMISKGPNSAANANGRSGDANTAVDQAESVAGSRRTEPKGGRGRVPHGEEDESGDDAAIIPDEAAPDEVAADTPASDEESSKPRRTPAKRHPSPTKKAAAKPSGDGTDGGEADESETTPPATKRKKSSGGLLTPGEKSAAKTKPSTKSSDAFLPPTGR